MASYPWWRASRLSLGRHSWIPTVRSLQGVSNFAKWRVAFFDVFRVLIDSICLLIVGEKIVFFELACPVCLSAERTLQWRLLLGRERLKGDTQCVKLRFNLKKTLSSVSLSLCLCVCVSLSLSLSLSASVSVCLRVCVYVSVSVCFSHSFMPISI